MMQINGQEVARAEPEQCGNPECVVRREEFDGLTKDLCEARRAPMWLEELYRTLYDWLDEHGRARPDRAADADAAVIKELRRHLKFLGDAVDYCVVPFKRAIDNQPSSAPPAWLRREIEDAVKRASATRSGGSASRPSRSPRASSSPAARPRSPRAAPAPGRAGTGTGKGPKRPRSRSAGRPR